MVPPPYSGYFSTAATAAGALIGLLFVAVSFRHDTIFGAKATRGGEALAITAFTGLVNAFFVSMLALVPKANIGVGATIMAAISIFSIVRLDLRSYLRRGRGTVTIQLLSLIAYTTQLSQGLRLLVNSHASGAIEILAYLVFASMAVALQRAWSLLTGKHLAGKEASTARPDSAG
jgi:hypothetical protein